MTADRERSLAAFEERFPWLARRFSELNEDLLELIEEDGVLVDVGLSGKRFYGRDGREFSRKQVELYLSSPYRTVIERPGSVGLGSPLAVEVGSKLVRHLQSLQEPAMPVFPRRGRTFLFVYGIGLGHELERLVDESGAHFILFIEPIVEVLSQSLKVVDWAGLFERLEERGAVCDFVTVDEPEAIHSAVQSFVYRHGPGFLDGAYIFQHYNLWSLSEAKRLLRGDAHQLFLSVGFFEDEEVMMRNTVGNFLRWEGGLLDGAPRRERQEPVFIIGSGPSLDRSIAAIKRLRGRAILVSCGTALSPLLRHGVVPDYHVELENGALVYDILSKVAAEHDLSGIRLLGSTSVDPRLGELFGQVSFFLRDSISSTRVFRGSLRQVNLCAPTCVNAALTCFSILGFKNFYLFGVDCGKRREARGHAAGSVYEWEDLGLGESDDKYDKVLRANFGGTVVTSWVYDLSRTMIERSVRHRAIEVVNCSDGAFIEGTVARLPECVDLPNGELDRPALLAELDRRFLPLDGRERIRAADLDGLMADAHDLCDMVRAMLAAAAESDDPFSEAYARIHSRTIDGRTFPDIPNTIIGSTVRAAARMAMYFGTRVSSDERCREIYDIYMEGFEQILVEMLDRLQAIVDEAKRGPAATLPAA